MANKRNLKKNIAYICSDIVGECIFAQQAFEGIDVEKMDEVIVKVALLQDAAIKKILRTTSRYIAKVAELTSRP